MGIGSGDDVRFRHAHGQILEVFDWGNYEGVDVRGKTVVDVGAFVGDSAIHFALKGARRVIAVEPHPGAYAEILCHSGGNAWRVNQ